MLADFSTVRAASEAVSSIIAAGIVPAALEMMDRPAWPRWRRRFTRRAILPMPRRCCWSSSTGRPTRCEAEAATVREILLRLRRAGSAERLDCRRIGPGSGRDAKRRSARWAALRRTSRSRTRWCPAPPCPTSWIRSRISAGSTTSPSATCFTPAMATFTPTSASTAAIRWWRHGSSAACREIMAACVAVGGSITGEHGVGIDKLDYMPWIFDAETLGAMRAVRRAFDPTEMANPGKVVPVHACREWCAVKSARDERRHLHPASCPARHQPESSGTRGRAARHA